MKKILFSLLILSALGGCRKRSSGPLIPEDYNGWKKLTDTKLDYPVPGHGPQYRISYINEIGTKVRLKQEVDGRWTYTYPEGTVVLKEVYEGRNFVPGSLPAMLTVMIKDAKHPDQQGGWVWIVKEISSGEETIFKDDMCIKCHAGANEPHPYGDENPQGEFRDYLFFPWQD